MNKAEFSELVGKISNGEATEAEIALYNRYYAAYQQAGEDWDEAEMGDKKLVYAKLKQRIHQHIKPVPVVPFWKKYIRVASAAAVLFLLSAGFLVYRYYDPHAIDQMVKQDVAPGGNKAVLTLANGRRITLTDAANGELAKESGISVQKTKDGQLVYTAIGSTEGNAQSSIYNTVSTPTGGQYQVNLPDGTKVWLNAASSLKFPANLSKLKERKVELSGEAYFEVSHQKNAPFIVKTALQEVLVLGTHFNVNSYTNENFTKTTLLKGSVLVRRTAGHAAQGDKDFVVLKPGQMATLADRLSAGEADVEMVTAWKDGNFLFNETDLRSILRQLERWYNVDVDYSNVPQGRSFTGFISRDVNLSKVLEMLEVTGRIKFKIDNKAIKIINVKE
jgi:transmembrane sensor